MCLHYCAEVFADTLVPLDATKGSQDSSKNYIVF